MSAKTSLYDAHVKLGAKMAPFAGFDMPIQYTSVKDEVLAVRNAVGIFDVSHMGEFFVEGKEAISFVDYLVTNDIKGAEMNKAVYSPLCRDNGTVIDDLIVYKLREEKIMICVNAANIDKDWSWISSVKERTHFDCNISNRSAEFSLLALQGPKTEEVLSKIGLGENVSTIPYYAAIETSFNGHPVTLARTGYTGEDGFEIFSSHENIAFIWDAFMANGVVPCGLASRDVLRLEVGYPLYGHELNDDITPLDSALKWTIKMDKEDFVGKAALADYNPKLRLIKLVMDKGIPRPGYQVENKEGKVIGTIVSGTMSVVLGKGVALAHADRDLFPLKSEETDFIVDIRGRKYDAKYVKQPFVTGGHK